MLTVLLSGCLFGNQREPVILFPADSLSRQYASTIPADTLQLQWQADSTVVTNRYINTVQYASDGTLLTSDLLQNQILHWSTNGVLNDSTSSEQLSYPYLVGQQGTDASVFSAGTNQLHVLTESGLNQGITLPETSSEDALSASVVVNDSLIYFKAVDIATHVMRLDAGGNVVGEPAPLLGPTWEHRGLLRLWQDQVLSLSAYRPTFRVITSSGQVDTLSLHGFDSPMLARSRAFMLGDDDTPPLMISSARPVDSLLFVLNLRPGVIRIDAYDTSGTLQHILEYHDLSLVEFTAQDLDVWRTETGSFEFAVASIKTQYQILSLRYVSRLDTFVWVQGSTF